jgi:hypothetical protein
LLQKLFCCRHRFSQEVRAHAQTRTRRTHMLGHEELSIGVDTELPDNRIRINQIFKSNLYFVKLIILIIEEIYYYDWD